MTALSSVQVGAAPAPRPERDEPALSMADFNAIAALVHETAGIVLGPTKRELVCGRLTRRMRALGLPDLARYRQFLEGPDGPDELEEMINAITTNLTSFFREMHHFEFLARDALPDLLRGRERRLRIWSAACSSGEEPYSIAMVLQKALSRQAGWDARILATDIDTAMIKTCEAGCYDAQRARAIPAEYRSFTRSRDDGSVEMTEALKARIAFRQLNLLGPWPMRGPFQIVFCRNVVIYFDKASQRTLFDRIADLLSPGGFLLIGHSESLMGVSDRFELLGHTIYRKSQ